MASRGDINKYEISPILAERWDKLPFEKAVVKPGDFVKLKARDFFDEGKFAVVDQGERFISGYVDDNGLLYQGELPVVIFGDHTRVVKYVDFPFAVGADGTKILKPINGIDNKFFYYYLRSLNIPSLGYSRHYKILKSVDVPIPPFPEQKLIVAKLDTLFAHLDQLRARLDKIPVLLKQFRQAVLTQAVTGKLTEEWRGSNKLTGWVHCTIGELFSVETGATPKRGESKYYKNGNIAWLKSGQVVNDVIIDAEEFITELAVKETNTKVFPVDTLLIAMYGEGKTRGQVGWMKLPAATNQAIAALVNEEMPSVTKSFVFYFCLSQYNEIRAKAEGGNQPNLNLSKIRNWEISLPPQEEQREIVRRAEVFLSSAHTIHARYQVLSGKIAHLSQSILSKAFLGGLNNNILAKGTEFDALLGTAEAKKASGLLVEKR